MPSKIVSTSVKFAPFSATKIRAWPFFAILILIILIWRNVFHKMRCIDMYVIILVIIIEYSLLFMSIINDFC
jgi:hypothetical protein